MATQSVFTEKEIVLYRNAKCMIQNIEKSVLGFNLYNIIDIDTGEVHLVNKHEIQVTDLPEMDWDTDIILEEIESDAENDENEEKENLPRRHAELDDEEIEEVANQRLSRSTGHQTKWAVNLFKGNIIVISYT